MPFASVTEYLTWDHEQMDAIRRDVQRMVDDGELERADHTFGELKERVRRHIRLEEDVLFPVFEDRTHIRLGPTTVMRREHHEIRRLVDRVSAALDEGSIARFRSEFAALVEILREHHAKEEHVLYPAIDRFLAAEERCQLLQSMQAVAA